MSLFLFRYVGRRIFCPGKIVAHHAEEFVRIPLVELDGELGKSWRRICTYTIDECSAGCRIGKSVFALGAEKPRCLKYSDQDGEVC